MTTTFDAERAVRAYRNLRDARDALRKKYEDEDRLLADKLAQLDAYFLDNLGKLNMMRAATPAGTVYRQVDLIPRVDDWETFYNHIRDTDAFEMLERRVGRAAVRRYMDTHADMPLPGVSVYREWKIGVRKPTDKVTD